MKGPLPAPCALRPVGPECGGGSPAGRGAGSREQAAPEWGCGWAFKRSAGLGAPRT